MVIGLTGGIGSGKSLVAKVLSDLGASVIDADALAREAVAPGAPALEDIKSRFGEAVMKPDGTLNRVALAELVFANHEERRALEQIVHPRVAALAMAEVQTLRDAGAKLIVYDVPLLYENGLDQSLPRVVVVDCPLDLRRTRIAARDGISLDAINARIAAQLPLEEKVARADHVIDNSGSQEETRAQVEALHAQLTARIASSPT